MSVWGVEWENDISGNHMNSVQEQTLAVLARGVIVEAKSYSPAPKTQTQFDGRRLSNGTGRREKVLLEGKVGKRAKVTFFSACQTHKSTSGFEFGDQCQYIHIEAGRQPSKKTKKSRGKDQLPYWRSLHNWVACLWIQSHRRSLLHGRAENWDRTVKFSKGTWHHEKIRERKGPSQGVTQKCELQERNPCAPKYEDGSFQETLQQERCVRREAWQKFGHFPRHLRKHQRRDNLWLIQELRCTCWARKI